MVVMLLNGSQTNGHSVCQQQRPVACYRTVSIERGSDYLFHSWGALGQLEQRRPPDNANAVVCFNVSSKIWARNRCFGWLPRVFSGIRREDKDTNKHGDDHKNWSRPHRHRAASGDVV